MAGGGLPHCRAPSGCSRGEAGGSPAAGCGGGGARSSSLERINNYGRNNVLPNIYILELEFYTGC